MITAALPELTVNQPIFDRVAGDIGRLGLSDTSAFKAMMTGGDSMLQPRATEFGRSFLAFISAPDEESPAD